MISGKVPASQALAVKRFTKEASEQLLQDVNPYTYLISIDVQPVEIGSKFEKIMDLKDQITGFEANLEHNPGEVIVINFWASWCKPSAKQIHNIL